MNRALQGIVVVSGVVLTALFILLSRIDGLNEKVGLFLTVFVAAFVAYVSAIAVLYHAGWKIRSRLLLYAFAVAATSRFVLVPSTPELSTDIYRYVWEGRLITNGFNPFVRPPDDPGLTYLRDRYYREINHKHLVTIYPPLSQAVFAAAARLRPDPRVLKLLFVLFDLGVIAMIGALLRSRSLAPGAATVYAWNPLVIFETGHSGHVEPVGIFFLIAALWLIARGSRLWGFIAIGATFLAKYMSAVLIPFFLVKKRYLRWVAVTAAVIVVGYLPFASAGEGLTSSIRLYSAHWRFNGLPYEVLETLLGNPNWTRRILVAAVLAVVAYHSVRQRDALRYSFIAVGAILLLAPTLYPWYVAWIVPFLCFYPNRAWILFTGLVFISYWVWVIFPVEGRWQLPWRLYVLEYAPFYGLLLFDALNGWRKSGEAPA